MLKIQCNSTLNHRIFLIVQVAILCLSLMGGAFADIQSLQGTVQYTDSMYRIGPGDLLSYHVYNQPDLAQTDILVREDGNASFNGAGEMFVSGRTVDEVNKALKERLSELLVNPVVTVNVVKTRPGTVYLAGAVKRPGMYQLVTQQPKDAFQSQPSNRVDLHLSNVLTNSGGVMMNADLSRIEISQANTGEVRIVNLWNMLKRGHREDDIILQSGDSVYVPAMNTAMSPEDYDILLRSSIGPGTFPIRIIGEVNGPGVYDLAGESPYLNSAIARAGGFRENANRKVVAIRRFTGENSFDTMMVEPAKGDVVLKPNDVIFISELKVYKIGRFSETVARILSPFTNVTNTFTNVLWLTRSNNNN